MNPTHSALLHSMARPGKTFSLIGLGALLACSVLPAHAQYADWTANPPKILPNERPGSGVVSWIGSGRQFPNLAAFAALKSNGSVVTWGYPNWGGDSTAVAASLSSNVTAVYSNFNAFAALKTDGSVVTWGHPESGGNLSIATYDFESMNYLYSPVAGDLTSNVTAVYSTRHAFAALKTDGSVVTWGNAFMGGDSTAVAARLSSNVTAVYSNDAVFAALKTDGSVVTWGSSDWGGDSTAVAARLSSNVTAVYSNGSAFAALKTDGSVVTWGLAECGGDSTAVAARLSSNVTAVYSNPAGFAALKTDGSVVTWGDALGGGDSTAVAARLSSNVTAVYSNNSAFAALKTDGSVVTWGYAGSGGDSTAVAARLSSNVTAVYSTFNAYAALKTDGSVVTWGSADWAGDSTAVAARLSSNVTAVYSNRSAFAALKTDGSVVTWGTSFYGGDSTAVAARLSSNVAAVYSYPFAFAALKTDGSIVAWGDNSNTGASSALAGRGFVSVQSVTYIPAGASVKVTGESTAFTSTTATLLGEVISEGSTPVTGRGFVYALATVTDPQIGDAGVTQLVDGGSGIGTYTTVLSGLTPNTAYVFRAYAVDEAGTTYGSAANFSTNLPPVITSNGGNTNVSVSVAENSSAVATINATDADAGQAVTYSIAGGADAARFAIGSSSGALTFVSAPDFEAPADANTDNVYQVIVAATDSGNPPKSATQTFTVTVTNVADSGEITVEQPAGTNVATGGTVAFGSVTVGQPLDLTFTVRSSGEVPLLLSGTTFPGSNAGEFALVGSLQSSLAVGSSTTFTVRFTPLGGGTRSAALRLTNNDQSGGESPFVINLSGTGVSSATVATYANAANQVRGGWINSGNFTIGAVGTTNPGNNWPSAEGPDKVVDSNTGSKFLIFRNNNAGVIFSPSNAAVAFNCLSLSTANDASERDPTSYVIYGSTTSLSGTAGTNISLAELTELASGTITLPDNRTTGPTVVQFANTTAYASYIVAFPTVRSTTSNNLTQISEVQLSQGINPPLAVAMAGARGGQLSSGTFTFGNIGSSNPGTNWNANESPDQAIDGSVSTKYLLFRNTGAGLIVSPQAGPARVNNLSFWTANDSAERDPLTYEVYGFATAVTARSGTLNVTTNGTLLGSGTLTLPATRNAGPVNVAFANSTEYASYLVVFPTVKNSPSTTIMQIAEVQFGYNGLPDFALPAGVTTPVGEIWTPHESNRMWNSICSSADGSKLAALGDEDKIYTSTDYGVTWTPRGIGQMWQSICSSADGTKLAAVAWADKVYTSTDSGVTWTPRDSIGGWISITSSAEGTKLAAVEYLGKIYTSIDSGATWTPRESNRQWYSICSSADGAKLAAVVEGGQIYTSTDSGVTWTPRESNRLWRSIASSADGTKLAAVTGNNNNDGQVFTSTDSGVTWTARQSIRQLSSITSSADGTKLAAATLGDGLLGNGKIYTSTDSGVTWTAYESNLGCKSIASSADGYKLAAVARYNQIYTSSASTASYSLSVAEDSGSFTQTAFATGISPGLGDVGQTVSVTCNNNNNALFSVQPAISADGTLTFTPAANANGSATVSVYATDSTGLWGASQGFVITVTPVTDAPVLAETPTSASIATTTATLGGEVTASEAAVTGRGVVYALTASNANPEIGDSGVTRLVGSGTTGSFTLDVTGLAASTSYSFRAYATSSAGTSYSAVGTFTTAEIPQLNPNEAWRQQYFGTTANTGNAADLATPDGDGVPNLMKYAFGLTPGQNGSGGLPKAQIATNSGSRYLSLNFRRDPSRNDVTILVEVQSGLRGEWTEIARSVNGAAFTGAAGVTETDAGDGTKNVEVRDTQTVGNSARRFMRVRVLR